MSINPGKFISFEGGNASGKSTQIKLLKEKLEQTGLDVIQTREIGGTPAGEKARELFLGFDWNGVEGAMIHYAARSYHVRNLIAPSLEQGKWVISDRFHDGVYAYSGYGLGTPLGDIDDLRRMTIGSFVPDLTLILDVDVMSAEDRLQRNKVQLDRFEKLDVAFHQRVRQYYLDLAKNEPARCVLIDARGTIEEVQQRVWQVVSARLGVS